MNLPDVDTMPWDREEEANADACAEDCAMCGGPLQVIGTLGRLLWFRCRNCGIECHRTAPTFESTDTEPNESPF